MIYLAHGLIKSDSEGATHRLSHRSKPTVLMNIQFPAKAAATRNIGNENSALLDELDREREYYVNEVMQDLEVDDVTDEDDSE